MKVQEFIEKGYVVGVDEENLIYKVYRAKNLDNNLKKEIQEPLDIINLGVEEVTGDHLIEETYLVYDKDLSVLQDGLDYSDLVSYIDKM
ncbi:hypothetical protein [Staphylococcus shinii]|uniref:hypothetical protein n=1 Tax=Staphylococcus shinii TaxID=2912228 RepID=UPI003F548E2D